jgi:membrane fusion protein (multidrug efflux system)
VKVTFLEDEKPKAAADKSPAVSPAVALVPQVAIRQDNSSKFVFVVKGDTLERRAVSLGSNRGTDVEILAGLQPGAVVVVKGPESLRDGQSVQIKQ